MAILHSVTGLVNRQNAHVLQRNAQYSKIADNRRRWNSLVLYLFVELTETIPQFKCMECHEASAATAKVITAPNTCSGSFVY